MPEIKDRVWGRVRKILKKVREEDNGDFWTDRILRIPEIAIVDREAYLLSLPYDIFPEGLDGAGWDVFTRTRDGMLKEGWVKEEK